MSTQTLTKSSFFHLRDRIEQEIARSIIGFGEKTKLRDACEYSLFSGGKRLRPIIVMMVAEALGNDLNVAPAALAVEFLHTASLIADDLPCMDNDDERRDKPSLHKVYGESIALLASYSLICAGFGKIHENAQLMKGAEPPFSGLAETACTIALELSSHYAGILGATGGQFLDLFPPSHNLETVKEIIYRKTVTLFQVSFLFGWIFGGGSFSELDRVKQVAYHLGMAFQIVDDMGDLTQDEKQRREINVVKVVGKERALHLFQVEMEAFRAGLVDLNLLTPSFDKMGDLLAKQALNLFQ